MRNIEGKLFQNKANLGAATTNLLDHQKPTICKKPDMLIIHTSAHDHGEDFNRVKKVKRLFVIEIINNATTDMFLC